MANVKTYYKSKSGNSLVNSLAPNFKVREFACKDGSNKILIDNDLILPLQYIRNQLGAVTITSGYRTPAHNKAEGGASSSMHLKGQAVDIKVSGKSPMDIGNLAYAIGFKRIIIYSSWVHLDTKESTYLYNEVTNSNAIFNKVNIPFKCNLKRKSKSLEVAIVQFKLKTAGYSIGNIDGIFGNKTLAAVKSFQKKNNLGVDGIVGTKTWNSMFNG